MKPLLFLAMFGILLLVFSIYLSLSVSPVDQVNVSVTTLTPLPTPLNYSAYQIQDPGVAVITLSYSFPQTGGSGSLNMTSILDNLTSTNTTASYTQCGFSNNEFVIENFTGAGVYPSSEAVDECGVNIAAAESEITYSPNLYTTVAFTMAVQNASAVGDYVFFPAGGGCGYSIFLIVGNKIPNKLPVLTNSGCEVVPNPDADISVIGIKNMTGLNIPY